MMYNRGGGGLEVSIVGEVFPSSAIGDILTRDAGDCSGIFSMQNVNSATEFWFLL